MTRIPGEFLLKFYEQVVPSGTINGSNVAFTLPFLPLESPAVLLYQDGLLLTQGTDYTISGTAITMTVAPALAQNLVAYFTRKTGE